MDIRCPVSSSNSREEKKKKKPKKKKRVQKCFAQWGNGGPKERNFRKRAK
jgi:hypothetical protein